MWLAYGGINGLTEAKSACLKGHKVLLIPDISEQASNVAYKRNRYLKSIGVNAMLWDMTDGKSDVGLKAEGLYNNDLEDYFRNLSKVNP